MNRTHGQAGNGGTPTYRSWQQMLDRCSNSRHHAFASYGGRGITVCERWREFNNFHSDMGTRPAGKTLDRYPDNDGNYEPNNCRWATPTEQHNNRRGNRVLALGNESMTLTQWARRIGIGDNTLRARLQKGWPLEKALTTGPLDYSLRYAGLSGPKERSIEERRSRWRENQKRYLARKKAGLVGFAAARELAP